MKKTLHVALREFLSTAATKGFIIGILITPLIFAVLIPVMKKFILQGPPRVIGEVAVIDPTGEVADGIRDYLRPEKIAERRERFRRRIEGATPESVRGVVASSPEAKMAIDSALGGVPQIDVVVLPATIDLEEAKAPLMKEPRSKEEVGRLALVVIQPDAVFSKDGKLGTYELFIRGKVNDRILDEIEDAFRESLVNARFRKATGLDAELVHKLSHVGSVKSTKVTARGEQATNKAVELFLPMAFMLLLMISVMTSGQYLLTTTVEEKSNRVVEVLLSAVSPMELMVGKILGQMGVGILILVLYAGLGIVGLVVFAALGLLDARLLVFLFVFYLLAYFTIGALMAAIGAAVNEMREAQTLMMPVMMMIMTPWIFWWYIAGDPNSSFAVIASFIPPISNFVMVIRLSSTSPPPLWQTLLSILVSAAGVYVALWFAAKVFRIGLLMFGKPPSFGTLIRWARMS